MADEILKQPEAASTEAQTPVTPAPDTGSLDSAADALAKAREDHAAEKESAPEALDTQPVEQDTDEAGAEEAETSSDAGVDPNTAPPAWFNSQEREAFSTLPPEAQAALLRLSKSAQTHISQRDLEHQQAMQTAQELVRVAAEERQYLQSAIQHYKHPIEAAFRQEFPDVIAGQMDMFRLAQHPERWSRYQAFQAKFEEIGKAENMVSQQREAEEEYRLATFVDNRNARLMEARPELKDPEKFEKFDSEITNYLRAKNVPDERIKRIDNIELEIVEDAMKWRNAQKARAAVPKGLQPKPGQAVVQSHLRTVGQRVMKPGVPNSTGALDERITAADQRAHRTGSLDDAADRIRLRLQKGMRS